MDEITIGAIVIILAILFWWFLGWVNSLELRQRIPPEVQRSIAWQEYYKNLREN